MDKPPAFIKPKPCEQPRPALPVFIAATILVQAPSKSCGCFGENSMATKQGFLTEWPWQRLGNFKYVVIAPWVAHSFYLLATRDLKDVPLTYLVIFPYLLLRMIHNQIWMSISRLQTAKSPHKIVDRGIDFEQVDRERSWDDQVLFNGILVYVGYYFIPRAAHLPLWRIDGVIMSILLHAGPVEFLYYWFHRAFHHHFLYSRYHSHHHASIVTEPITSVIHPFAEHIVFFALFSIPLLSTPFMGKASIMQFLGERNKLKDLKMQTLFISRFSFQNGLSSQKEAINGLIEKTIFEADDKGVKVLTLRLYNQANQPNGHGKLYLYKRPMLKVRIVDESSLATIVILNSIRQDIKQILFKGHITKVAYTVIQGLCCKGVKVKEMILE
ncbi:hypothetical protein HPP92_011092 [Vanilla planifolia]|uniref:aldehyde oxygenase (deformylating) n=1 Tax=Vanilla planifolia TaxID=51239 RepID=A0A835V358_VANPL|nr:hypothetical protein HPP92_011092 [Vanilla planifolia]